MPSAPDNLFGDLCGLVAPVFDQEGNAEFYLPEGVWTEYFTGEQVTGGRWIRRQVDYLTIPLYVRPGSDGLLIP